MAAYHKLQKLGTKLRAIIWEKTDGKCWYCGFQTNPWRGFCLDHFDNHGDSSIENLVPCCRGCNTRKSSLTLEEFRALLQFYAVPKFTEKQRAYLLQIGSVIPENLPTSPTHVFWFEKEGLQL